jgi:hypothetical protein
MLAVVVIVTVVVVILGLALFIRGLLAVLRDGSDQERP